MLREEDPTSKLLFGYVQLFIIVRIFSLKQTSIFGKLEEL